jgi:hypothetical protein
VVTNTSSFPSYTTNEGFFDFFDFDSEHLDEHITHLP